jgi:cell division protein FtsX
VTPGFLLRRATARARRAPLVVIAVTLAFAVVSGLAAAAAALSHESARAREQLTEQTHVVAYLDAGLPAEQAAALVIAFQRLGGVAAAREVSGRDALVELQATIRSAGARGDLLGEIEPDLLPRSIEITLAPGGDLPGRARDVADRLGRLPGVTAVDAMADGLTKMASAGVLTAQLSSLFSAVAALAALSLLGGLVIRERAHHRELAETMHLLGARGLSMWLPLGIGDAVAALLGGMAGWQIGGWVTMLVLEGRGGLPAMAIVEVVAGAIVFVAAGLLMGRLSLPRPRGALGM